VLPHFFGAVDCMPERKRRSDLVNLEISDSEGILLEDEPIELGSGYSISLDNTKETPVVYVKTYGEVDVLLLQKKLERYYPEAKIEGLLSNASVQVAVKRKKRLKAKSSKK